MSDIVEQKLEEPVALTETPAVVDSTAAAPVEETPVVAESSTTETTAHVVEEPSSEAAVAAPVEEVKEIAPISEGIIGYKAPGLLKSLRFSKKFFWLGDEAVESKHLSNYLRGEKPEVGNKNGAWAAHTGKGLLFFSKTASEKTTPHGIINLAEISDVTNDSTLDFFFQYQGHKHTFQAATAAERESWVLAIKNAATEAKANAEGITTSESYNEHFAALSKPAVVTPAAVKKEEKAEDKAEKKEEKKEEKAEEKAEKKEEKVAEAADKEEAKEEKKEEKTARKSRSQSRKRSSIFGGFNKKKEEPKTVEPEVAAASVETPAAEVTEVAAPVEVETVPVETAAETEATTPPATSETPVRQNGTKRSSIFGQLQSRFSSLSNKKEEAAPPAVPAKDETVAPETTDAAPVIPAVESETPLSADINSPATVPTETTTVPETTEAVAAPVEASPKVEKRKSSLPFGLGGKNSPGLLSRFGTKKSKKPVEETPAVTSEKIPEAASDAPVTEIPSEAEVPVEATPKAAETAPVVSSTA